MSDGNRETALRPSWDIPGSAFKTLDLLRELIKVSSQDNVQPQAMLAAEALGVGILVSPIRIQDALEALEANSSFRLEQTRITLGLVYGNTQRTMRTSTPLLQFFVFVTAFRFIYNSDEIGDIMFEMMANTGLLSKLPVSSIQFARLVDQVAANSNRTIPIDLFHEIATMVAEYDVGPHLYYRLDYKSLASFFASLFEAMNDHEIEAVSVTGQASGVWMATVLLWWFEDKACLTIGQNVLKGKPDTKLIIQVGLSAPGAQNRLTWKLEAWKKLGHPMKNIIQTAFEPCDGNARMPLINLKNFIACPMDYTDETHTPVITETVILETIAGMARALILLVLEKGGLFRYKSCCAQMSTKDYCTWTPISMVANLLWLRRLDMILRDYGWTEIPGCEEIYEELKIAHSQEALEVFCGNHVRDRLSGNKRWKMYRNCAILIATDAILTCTVQKSVSIRYFNESSLFDIDMRVISSLCVTGLSVSEFRKLALDHITHGQLQVDSDSLMFNFDGIVAGMSILCSHAVDQRGACSIVLIEGSINYEGINYSSIHEGFIRGYISGTPVKQSHPVKFATKGTSKKGCLDLADRPLENFWQPETLISVSGPRLNLKQRVFQESDAIYSSFNWTTAIDVLVTAVNPTFDLAIDPTIAESIENDMQRVLATQVIECVSPSHPFSVVPQARWVINSDQDNLVRIFAASRYGIKGILGPEFLEEFCQKLVVHSGGSLVHTLRDVYEHHMWVLLL